MRPGLPHVAHVRPPWPSNRDTCALLAGPAGADAAVAFATDNSHPRLWRLIAEHALQAKDWALAERGFVHCSDLAVGREGGAGACARQLAADVTMLASCLLGGVAASAAALREQAAC